ncbi:MAG: glycosyltransferase [Candidatus Micrarchaeia archaeon]
MHFIWLLHSAFGILLLISLVMSLFSIAYYLFDLYFVREERKKLRLMAGVRAPSSAKKDVTAVVPVYNEDPELFERCVKAISIEGIRFIIVGDSSLEPYKSITEKAGGQFIYIEEHGGKRMALAEGIKHVDTKYVLFVDSDTVIGKDTVSRMLPYFSNEVGGVGAKIQVRLDKRRLSTYALEFFHRLKEFGFAGLEHLGMPMVLDGECAMYRTELVKNYMQTNAYRYGLIFGRRMLYADDRQLTAHILDLGYKAVRAHNVVASTKAPKTVRAVIRQAVRWTRAGYLYFFKELLDGTYLKRRSPIYSFQMVYMYALPVLSLFAFLLRSFETLRRGILGFAFVFQRLSLLILRLSHFHIAFLLLVISISAISYFVTFIYIYALAGTIRRRKKRTLSAGGLYLLLLLFVSVYGLLTFWKQEWKRDAPGGKYSRLS